MGEPLTPEEASELMLEGYHGTVALPDGAVVTCPSCGHEFTPGQGAAGPVRLTENDRGAGGREAMVGGRPSFDDVRELVRKALTERQRQHTGDYYWFLSIADLTDTEVVYGSGDDQLWQCSYTLDEAGQVTLGESSQVVRTYAPTPAAAQVAEAGGLVEERGQVSGRVLEAKGTDDDGGRIFRMQIIAAGDSRNRRRYPLTVLHEAAALYEGAKAYDHHRTDSELQTSTIAGIVGGYRDVTATSQGLEADLHLLPGASHAAEVLDAALAGTLDAGVSHDVMALYKTTTEGGERLQEATAIVKVNSVDIVADPAAGGKALRMVAGGSEEVPSNEGSPGSPPTSTPEPTQEGYRMDPKALRRALGLSEDATDEQVAAKTVALREAFGLPADATPDQVAERATRAREALDSGGITPAAQAPQAQPEPTRETEATVARASFLGRAMIREAVAAARLPEGALDQVTQALPEQITEAQVDRQVAAFQQVAAMFERAGLAPQAGNAEVTKESRDRKVEALDAMFAGDYTKGYHSIKQAWEDFTGARPHAFDGDINRRILRESAGIGYDSATRSTEALDSASWAQVLGDSITRRMVAEYRLPGLDSWRQIASDIVPVQDFRTNRRTRVGGYGVLPAVLEAAPYQPLTSPGDEEATYAVTKRGGLESITLEMIANDDVGALRKIPQKLGRAAAWTLYRFFWDTLVTNAAATYDSVALFHASHGNTDTSAALAQATLSTGRRKLRDMTAYGNSTEVLGPSAAPRFLIIPNDLEEIAFQLTTSAVAVPSSGSVSDMPNIHQGLTTIIVDYYSDTNDWFLVADPAAIPTVEVGFYQGREAPELFTQADPSVGSMFDSDELTYKIRHIYGLTVLDHRGFYRGQG